MKTDRNKIIKETMKSALNELGGMEDNHPVWGDKKLSDYSLDQLEDMYNQTTSSKANKKYNDEDGGFAGDEDVIDEDIDLSDEVDDEMSGAAHRRDFKPTSREKDIMSVFGDMYGEDVPPVVIRYMRKNPEKIIRRLYKVYGDKLFDYIPKKGMDEVEQKTVKQYDFNQKGDVEQFNKDLDRVTDTKKITVGDKGAQISENDIKRIKNKLKNGKK